MSGLTTPRDLRAWLDMNQRSIEASQAANQARVDDSVAKRIVYLMLGAPITFEQAGDECMRSMLGTRDGVTFTRENIRKSLLAAGWIPKGGRRGAKSK